MEGWCAARRTARRALRRDYVASRVPLEWLSAFGRNRSESCTGRPPTDGKSLKYPAMADMMPSNALSLPGLALQGGVRFPRHDDVLAAHRPGDPTLRDCTALNKPLCSITAVGSSQSVRVAGNGFLDQRLDVSLDRVLEIAVIPHAAKPPFGVRTRATSARVLR